MSASLNELEDFLNGGLISWLESCLPRPEVLSGYASLLDGSIIFSVCLQIDPEPQQHLTKLINLDGVAHSNARAKNFDAIVKNIKALYEEELGQTVLVLPDCGILGHCPETKSGLEQMKLLLTLLLGAAVQCPNKEIFIARIKELEVDTQHAIVELIKQVTDNQTLVLTQESLEQLSPNKMYSHMIRLAKERDQYHSSWISSLVNESTDSGGTPRMNGELGKMTPSNSSTSASSSDNNHLAVELADMKSKLRKLRQELEDKSEAYMEVKEELDHKSDQFEKLRLESQEWYSEARKASAYRDEVDVLRERAERADRLEVEVQRFREKLSDAEFYKTRVDELREDNRLLSETRDMLEDQLQHARKRSDHAMTLEADIIKYKQKLNDLALERDADKNKFQELLDENTQLQIAAKNLTNPNLDAENSLSDLEDDSLSGDNSLSEQLTNNAQSRALKLELENRRLSALVESMKESSFHESSNKILDLEKEKKKLSIKLEQLQDNCHRMNQQNSELENVFKNALEENKKLQDSLDANKQAADKLSQDREIDKMKLFDLDKHVESLNKDKQRIQTLSESIQRRANDSERTVEAKMKEVQVLRGKVEELEVLKKDIYEMTAKLSTAEKENVNLTKEVLKFKENIETKDVLLDENISKLESQTKEIQTLAKNLEDFENVKQKFIELETRNHELTTQSKIDIETISTLQKDLVSGTLETKKVKSELEKLGIDEGNGDINVEHVVEKWVKNPETFKTVREIMLSCGRQISSADICVLCHRKETYTVQKEIEITPKSIRNNVSAVDLLIIQPPEEFSIAHAELREQHDQLMIDSSALRLENEILQAENARQKVDSSTLSSQITALNTQHVALQLANSQLAVEKDILVKKIDGVKQQYESLLHDQVTLQCLHEQLNSEYEALNKEKEMIKSSLRDIRLENRDRREHETALEKLVDELKAEIESIKKAAVSLTNLRAEHSNLKDDFRHLFTTSEKLKIEYKNIHDQYRTLRADNSQLKLQNTELSGELSNRGEQLTSHEIELNKVNQKCEMLVQMNTTLDTDRRTLMDHVSQLLTQYHELLEHSLDDKQHYHEEEKQFTDKVNNLYRQKEKLEEKIMEHYRKLDSCSPKKKTFGSSLVKRMRKAGSDLMNKVPSRNRRSWIEDGRTQSNFTLGSESGGNDSDNSAEDPNSIMSDTVLLQKYSKLRQTLPRKPKEKEVDVTEMNGSGGSSGGGGGTLTRGGVRSSLQQSTTRPKTNSISNLDTTEVAGSFSLGTAGSRRTVYLVDENSKIPADQKTSTSSPGTPTPTNETAQVGGTGENNGPSTFLMYNRISTMIGSGTEAPASLQTNGSSDNKSVTSDRKKNGNGKSKESAVWYEYGCV